jgi:2-succinyl-6-hydroxy-2,4-cyclohexadiene-1-carboxylate synthase
MPPALVLLHGFTHTGASWEPVTAALGERYRAIAPDIRGHGSAGDREPVTLEAVLGDLLNAAPAQFTLGGYSMGGRIALHVALAEPQRVQRLVLIGASPGIAEQAERDSRREADERLAAQIEESTIEQFARTWATGNPVLAGQPATVRRAVHEDRLRNSPAALAHALRGLGAGALPSLWDRLGELAMPVTLIVGERDDKFREIASRMQASLSAGTVVVVEGAGHAVHLEAPGAVARAF